MTDKDLVAYLTRRHFAPMMALVREIDDTLNALDEPDGDLARLQQALVIVLSENRPPGVDRRALPKAWRIG